MVGIVEARRTWRTRSASSEAVFQRPRSKLSTARTSPAKRVVPVELLEPVVAAKRKRPGEIGEGLRVGAAAEERPPDRLGEPAGGLNEVVLLGELQRQGEVLGRDVILRNLVFDSKGHEGRK